MATATVIQPKRGRKHPSIEREWTAAFEKAYRVALLLTGTPERAEAAILAGIENLDDDHLSEKYLLAEAVKSALWQNAMRSHAVA